MTFRPATLLKLLIGTLFILPAGGGAAEIPARTVSVSGSGEITAAPDRATVSFGVEARAPALAAARNEVNRTVDRFLKVCDELDIERKRVATTGATVRPEYDWDKQTRERSLSGYHVIRSISVDLRDLEQLGALMERAVDVGINQVQPPQLGSTLEDELRRDALALAATDAQMNAEVLARTLGAKVGPVRRIATMDAAMQPPPIRPMAEARMAVSADGGAETYESGEIRFSAKVVADFDLLTEE